MDNGKYEAVTQSASVYEKEGKLMLAVEFRVGDELLKSFFVLVKADGMANEGVIRGIRDWSGWDGIDPYWIQDNAAIEQWACEVVVAMEPGFKDPSRMFPNIQWVNTVRGGASALPTSDRQAILAEFGPMLRAMAGPQPVINSRHTPVKTAAPAIPPTRVPTPAPTRPPLGGVNHTQTSCWDALQAGQPNASQPELENLWYSIVTGDQATMTSADWARVADAISRLSVKAATADEEPMPF